MYIDGRWLTEPEIEAYIKRLRTEISEYDIELKELREQQNVNDKLERITANYTFGQQRQVFAEECAEAIKAVCKVERAADSSAEVYAEKMSDLISEVADVLIMAQQIRMYLGAEKVDAEIQRKLDRQLERIREEQGNESDTL
ncbi:MAG: hypothetical protein Q4A05_07665 [Ruminococcus sp.]|nr:hypothetical protein [Ruminococcus sp.]